MVLFQTGFRIFFLGAAIQTVLSMLVWLFFYVFQMNIFVRMPLTIWHSHEMIYGFSMAVVAGFLLTAVMNWTGRPTLNGWPLAVLFLLWATARGLAFMPASFPLWPQAVCDTAFLAFLSYAVMKPIILEKQWQQSAVFSKLILLLVAGIIFYVALAHADFILERKCLKFAVYMIISLILTIGRRIIPFFIERGVGYPIVLRNSRFLDLSSMVLILMLSIIDVIWTMPWLVSILALGLAVVHTLRLWGWYTPGIWQKPLLWVLFLGYIFIIIGFLLKAGIAFRPTLEDAATHAFTAGGIGVFILGMMARVSWGHTGRNIGNPLPSLGIVFMMITVSAFVRVFFTLADPTRFAIAIAVSQVLWMIAYVWFFILYVPIWLNPRPDGKPG